MTTAQEEAFRLIVDEELHTLVTVLESAAPGKVIYAFLVALDPPVKRGTDIEYDGTAHRWHSDDILQSHGHVVKNALEREIEKLEKAIET